MECVSASSACGLSLCSVPRVLCRAVICREFGADDGNGCRPSGSASRPASTTAETGLTSAGQPPRSRTASYLLFFCAR
eukprot:693812-Rhodomonas_salina.2